MQKNVYGEYEIKNKLRDYIDFCLNSGLSIEKSCELADVLFDLVEKERADEWGNIVKTAIHDEKYKLIENM